MKTFQYKLPAIVYTVKAKNLTKFLQYLNSWDVDIADQDLKSEYVTVLCGDLFKVLKHHRVEYEADAITPKQFKRIVRQTVGEPE